MYPEQFEYHRPSSVTEAIGLLTANPDAKLLAGGHSLLPAMKLRLAAPPALVDITRLDELKGIEVSANGARIGAGVTYRELMDSSELAGPYPVIADACDKVGDPAVRSRGTLGGSLAHVDPAADLTAVMLALDATITATGPDGERQIGIDDFFVGLLASSLSTDEILTSISLPAATANTRQAYEKHAHPASGYAVVGVAVSLQMDGSTCRTARIGVTGAPEFAMRAKAAEDALAGQAMNAETIAAAAEKATDGLGELNGDVYASADYRAHLVKVMTRRALTRAAL
ncbi:MAG: xanthine dehydrogenase family protein subunit M [Thermomicrobiales bacterium]